MFFSGPKEKKYKDNPNPNAKTAFVIAYPYQFYVGKNIYAHLSAEAEFIIDPGSSYPIKHPTNLTERIIAMLQAKGVFFRILYYNDYDRTNYLENFFSKYEVLVALWEWGCLKLKANQDRKKVRLAYGSGKELNMYRVTGRRFNLALAYGARDSQAFSLFSKTIIVGNPKFDEWFGNKLDGIFLEKIKQKLNPKKSTILYLPTFGDLSAIKDLAPILKSLGDKYNVLTKFHYFNLTDDPDGVRALNHESIIKFYDDTDLLPLLRLADVIISDNSSAIFDAILADKPVVVTDFLSEEYLDVGHKIPRFSRPDIICGGITYSGSIEQTIKKEGLILTIKSSEELPVAILRALRDETFFKSARKKIRDDLFTFQDDKCGQRAAEAIERLRASSELPEKTPLSHKLDAANVRRLARWKSKFTPLSSLLETRILKNGTGFLKNISPKIALFILKIIEKVFGYKFYAKLSRDAGDKKG